MKPQPRTCILLIALAGVLTYSGIWTIPFQFDDTLNVALNGAIKNPFRLDVIWEYNLQRFVTYFSFALNFATSGNSLVGYHFVSLLAHITTGIGLFVLCKLLFRNLWAALFTALIYVCHPVNSQAVVYIVQRSSLFAGAAFVWGCYFYIRSLQENKPQSFKLACIAIAIFFAGSFSKQNIASYPAALLVLTVLVDQIPKLKMLFCVSLPAVLLTLLSALIGDKQWNDQIAYKYNDNSPWTYFLTELRVIPFEYIPKVLLLKPLQLDFDIEPATTLLDSGVLLGAFFIVSTLAAASWSLFKRKAPYVGAGVLIFYLMLVVESSFIALEDFAFEHRLYTPCIGLSIAAAGLLNSLFARFKEKQLYVLRGVCGAVVLSLMSLSYIRVQDWQSIESLWKSNLELTPDKGRVWHALGMAAIKRGDIELGFERLEEGARRDPQYKYARDAISELKNSKKHILSYARACKKIETSKELSDLPTDLSSDAASNLAVSERYLVLGTCLRMDIKLQLAETAFALALKFNEENISAYWPLSEVLEHQGKLNESMAVFLHGLEKSPRDLELLEHAAIFYLKFEQPQQSSAYARRAIEACNSRPSCEPKHWLYKILEK